MSALQGWRSLEADAKDIASYTGEAVSQILAERPGVRSVLFAPRKNRRRGARIAADQVEHAVNALGVVTAYGPDLLIEVELGTGQRFEAHLKWPQCHGDALDFLAKEDDGILFSVRIPGFL